MQRYRPFPCVFNTGNVGSVQSAGNAQSDAKRTHVHRHLHSALHRTPKCHAALKLHTDILGDELGVQFRVLDLGDLNVDLLAGHLAELLLDAVDLSTLAPDDYTRPSGVNGDSAATGGALNLNARHGGGLQFALQQLANLVVLDQ